MIKIEKYSSQLGFYNINYPFAYGEENNYFMLHQKFIPIEEYKNSTQKDEYEYLYVEDDEVKGNNFDNVDNEENIDYGNDFINWKIIPSKGGEC